MKRKRPALRIEQLEARETPDVSLGRAALSPPRPPAALVSASPAALSPLPPGDGNQAADTLAAQALEAFFADAAAVERLLASAPGARATAAAPATPAETPEGWQLLANYTRKAIRTEEARYGPLPDHEDLVHQTFIEWREQVGPSANALGHLLQPDSAERLALRKAVRRVLDHARYETNRQRRTAELVDQAAPVNAAEQEWREVLLDVSLGAGGLAPRERQTLELRGQGMTFEEIGAELGLVKQRVCELYSTAVGRLQELYCS